MISFSNKRRQLFARSGVMISVFISLNLYATNYYIANNGNNDDLGTSPSTAWETITHVNDQSFLPGDSILFRRGDVWRNDALGVSSSGNSAKQIVYGAYGSGERPEILGSVLATGWTNVSGNIWAAEANIEQDPWGIGYDGPEIFFEENKQSVSWGIHQSYTADFSNLMNEYHWTWNNNTIYIYSPTNPASRYDEVEIPQLSNGIYLMDHNYISFDNLTIKYYGDAGIYDQYATIELYGLRVTNCEISHIGRKNGGAAYGLSVHHSDSYYAYNEIHNCGRRGISITLYDTDPITQSNVIIEHNYFHHGWHTTSLDGSITGGHTLRDIIFRNNLVEGDPEIEIGGVNSSSNHVFMSHQSSSGGTVQNVYFYNNVFTWAHGSSIKIGSLDSVYIYNNTFYNFNLTQDNWQAHAFCGSSTNITIMNNIFYNNAEDNRFAAIECHNSTVDELSVNYNLYYNTDSTRRMFWIDGGTSYDMEQWGAYRAATGKDANSPAPADPRFINPSSNYGLGEGSPAIGRGVLIDWIYKDYYGSAVNNPADIGAIRYGNIMSSPSITLQNSFTISPNPAAEFCKISVSVPASENYIIRLYNLQGKQVYISGRYAGPQLIFMPLLHLPPGIYLVERSSGTLFKETKKLIIGR